MRSRLQFMIILNRRDPVAMPKNTITEYRRSYKRCVRLAKIKANDEFIRESSNPQQAMWKLVNNNRKNVTSDSNLKLNSTDFNNFFCSTAENVLEGLSGSQRCFEFHTIERHPAL